MAAMKCPDCGAQRFYVKDPEDHYTLCEFSLENGRIEYLHDEAGKIRYGFWMIRKPIVINVPGMTNLRR